MDKVKLKNVLETLLFVANRPLGLLELSDIVGETQEDVRAMIDEIQEDLKNKGSSLLIAALGEGYQMATREGYGYWVKKLFREQTTYKLSQSAMETLSIVAYKQPISRAEIEEVRGVEVSGVLDTLVDRRLIKVVGRKETVGRPLLYATTEEFLRHFHLWKVSDLPSLEDLAAEAERNKGQQEQVAAAEQAALAEAEQQNAQHAQPELPVQSETPAVEVQPPASSEQAEQSEQTEQQVQAEHQPDTTDIVQETTPPESVSGSNGNGSGAPEPENKSE